MYTAPSPDDVLEGVIVSLQNDVLPNLTSARAQVALVMAQALLQMLRQVIPVLPQGLATEHNEMAELLRRLPSILGDSAGPEAERISERAASLGSRADFPAIPTQAELSEAHNVLGRGLVDTLRDLDLMIREGNTAASDALQTVRAHLASRAAREVGSYVVAAGMVGRG